MPRQLPTLSTTLLVGNYKDVFSGLDIYCCRAFGLLYNVEIRLLFLGWNSCVLACFCVNVRFMLTVKSIPRLFWRAQHCVLFFAQYNRRRAGMKVGLAMKQATSKTTTTTTIIINKKEGFPNGDYFLRHQYVRTLVESPNNQDIDQRLKFFLPQSFERLQHSLSERPTVAANNPSSTQSYSIPLLALAESNRIESNPSCRKERPIPQQNEKVTLS